MKNNNSDVTPRVVCGYAVPRGATVAHHPSHRLPRGPGPRLAHVRVLPEDLRKDTK